MARPNTLSHLSNVETTAVRIPIVLKEQVELYKKENGIKSTVLALTLLLESALAHN